MINLHNHTIWSDGNFTVLELAEAAAERGVTVLGISDHFETDKCRCMFGRENITQLLKEIKAAEGATGIRVLAGAELDLMNMAKRLAILPNFEFPSGELNRLDYLFFEYAGPLYRFKTPPNPWIKGDKGQNSNTWKLMLQFRKKLRIPVFLAHPRFDTGFDQPDLAIAKVLKTLNIGIEVNSGERNSIQRDGQKIYHFELKKGVYTESAKLKIPFITGTDTHIAPEGLDQLLPACEYLKKIGGTLWDVPERRNF